MHALPFPLWNNDILNGTANTLGRFVSLEKDYHLIFNKRTAKVLVEIDVSKGILPKIDIVCNSRVFTQRLDYLNMPLKCSYFHETGHLRNTCHSLLQGQPLILGFSDLELYPVSPWNDSPSNSELSPTSPVEPSPPVDFTGMLTPLGPYDSSSPTIFSDLTIGELQYL